MTFEITGGGAITLDNTLVILSTVAPDAGRYYVQAVNDKNGDNKTSQPITLAVANVGGPADPIAPTIIVPPRNTSVVAGTSEVTMECVANARPLMKLHIVWKKDGTPLSSGISDYSRRLTILNPALGDSGYYECEAVLRSSSVPAVAQGAYLSVLEPPQFVKEPERHITAEMEKVVAIPCQAKGVPPPATAWYKDAALIPLEKLSRFRLLADGSLQISGLLPDDTGMFQCFAPRTRITDPPQDQSVIKGTKAFMSCGVTHDPSVGIRWVNLVMYKEKDSEARARFWLVEGNASRSAQLAGLREYVLYEIRVLAFTRIGDGCPDPPWASSSPR
nr:PREDICTED: protein sidekick-2 [Apteryx mantelli mantelli]